MKKCLLVFGILVFCASSVFARSMPRWSAFPVSVYLPPEASQSVIVKGAFNEWRANSKYILRFIFKQSNVAKKNAKIKVAFKDSLSNNKPYQIREVFSFAPFMASGESTGYYYRVDINIALKDSAGRKYSKKELRAISLQAVGRALGIRCDKSLDGVMACNSDLSALDVTKDDYKALHEVYRKTKKNKKDKD